MDSIAMELAREAAKQSRDPSTKVGAVVVGRLGSFHVGWNKMPIGAPEGAWNDRDTKLRYVLHAEEAAILAAGHHTRDGKIFITHWPCLFCCRLIVAAGIMEVRAAGGTPPERWRESCCEGRAFLKNAGLTVRYV